MAMEHKLQYDFQNECANFALKFIQIAVEIFGFFFILLFFLE